MLVIMIFLLGVW